MAIKRDKQGNKEGNKKAIKRGKKSREVKRGTGDCHYKTECVRMSYILRDSA